MLGRMHSPASASVPAGPSGLLAIASPAARLRLERLARSRRLDPGAVLFDEGEPASDLFEIVSGLVTLYSLLPDGRRQVIGFLGAGRLLGLALGARHACTAVALGTVEVRRYARGPFEAILDEDPGLLRHLMTRASDELAAAQEQLLLLGRKTALERVASFLLDLAERSPTGEEIDIPMGRQDIADYLGLTTETVSRTLGQLKASGLVAFGSARHAAIRRIESLRAVAEGALALDAGAAARPPRTQRAAWPA